MVAKHITIEYRLGNGEMEITTREINEKSIDTVIADLEYLQYMVELQLHQISIDTEQWQYLVHFVVGNKAKNSSKILEASEMEYAWIRILPVDEEQHLPGFSSSDPGCNNPTQELQVYNGNMIYVRRERLIGVETTMQAIREFVQTGNPKCKQIQWLPE